MAEIINVNDCDEVVGGEGLKISTLSNAMNYFIQSVFILVEDGVYRLVAIHNDTVLTDECYKTAKGAKIAFLKLFWYRAWREGIKPEWTHFYLPDKMWLGSKLSNKKIA